MSENTKIEWCDHTFNPWEGCQKVGPGCDHCYAESRNARFAGGTAMNWGPGAPRRLTSPANWRKPLAWNARPFLACRECGWRGDRPANVNGIAACPEIRCASFDLALARRRVFCASLADVFDKAVSPTWRAELFELIERTPNLDWLLLTKRIGNVSVMLRDTLGDIMRSENSWPWPNVWLGATIVNQAEADRDIPKLLEIPARVRFLSMEPLLGPVDLRLESRNDIARWDGLGRDLPLRRIDWVIVGGESGHGARPMHPDWARSLRDQCEAARVPFLFKQHGEWRHMDVDEQMANPDAVVRGRTTAWPDGIIGHGDFRQNGGYGKPIFMLGKKAAGRLLDGRTHDEFPGGST
ncbi:phage Gp37/Gp68 family protein [Burkholderia sp. PU8-34]